MFQRQYFARRAVRLFMAIAALTFQTIDAHGDDQTAAQRQTQLIAVLTSPHTTPAEKAVTCKYLALCGDKNAVPALAALLPDERLAAWARIALEAIPDQEADDALRDAATQLQGRVLVGIINSIGMRRDGKAVAILARKLGDSNVQVAASAAVALGRIGTPPAVQALEQFLTGPAMTATPSEVRSAVAEGCILCAERNAEAGKTDVAIRLFDAIYHADVPKQRKREAARGKILAQQSTGTPELLELLRSDDKDWFGLGLSVARELPGPGATTALVEELEKTTPERQSLLMLAIMDREDRPPMSMLVQAAKEGPKDVRIAAIQVMRRQGDVTCVPVLLAAGQQTDADIASAAIDAMEDIPGAAVNADLAERLPKADGTLRLWLIELAGHRRITAAVPELLKTLDDADAAARAAAVTALGATVDFAGLPVLVERTIQAKNSDELAVAGDALKSAASRMPDRGACAEQLASAMPKAGVVAKCRLLEALGAVGGEKALVAIAKASQDSDTDVQGAAAKALGDWMTPAAAPVLLQLAKSAANDKLKTRALRGYLRIARQFVVPDDERLTMYQTAMDVAQRDEERCLAIDVLIRIPSVKTLKAAVNQLCKPTLRESAAKAAVNIAGKLVANQPAAVAEAMQEVIDSGVGDSLQASARELLDQAKAAIR